MIVEFLTAYRMPDGVTRKRGELVDVPDDQAAALVKAGVAREAGKWYWRKVCLCGWIGPAHKQERRKLQ